MRIRSSNDLGSFIKSTRKRLKLTQSEVAGASGTGVRFIVDLEHGKPTCELAKALLIASMLGIKIEAIEPSKGDK